MSQLAARAEQAAKEEARRLWHVQLLGLLRGKRTGHVVLARAKSATRKWRRCSLCSMDFIMEWERLLAGSQRDLLALLAENSARGRRLRQNSPFWCSVIAPKDAESRFKRVLAMRTGKSVSIDKKTP